MTKRVRDSSANAGMSLKKLCSNPDAMKSLGAYLAPRSDPKNELRCPSLVLRSYTSPVVSFVEQTNEANHWKVKHYFCGYAYREPTAVFYRKASNLSLDEFLSSLLQDIYDYHMIHRDGNNGKWEFNIYFAEAREEKEFLAFLAGYKSKMETWDNERYGVKRSKKKFCYNFDAFSLVSDVEREDDFYLVLMQYKYSPLQCKLSYYSKLSERQKVRQESEFARFIKAFKQLLSGDMLLQHPFTKKVTIYDKLYPSKNWRELIFSKYP